MSHIFALQPSSYLFFVALLCVTFRAAAAAEKSQLRSPSLRQLQSLIAFLPREEKCEQLLFDLMKGCVEEDRPLPATTSTTRAMPKTTTAPSATYPPFRAVPMDDEDVSFEGSGTMPEDHQRLPESLYSEIPVSLVPQTMADKEAKSERKKTARGHRVSSERAAKRGKVKKRTKSKAEGNSGAAKKAEVTKPKQPSWEESHDLSPDFFKYMGMG